MSENKTPQEGELALTPAEFLFERIYGESRSSDESAKRFWRMSMARSKDVESQPFNRRNPEGILTVEAWRGRLPK